MMRLKMKHAINDPRGDGFGPSNPPPLVFKPRLFKYLEIQATWLPDFKKRAIITRKNIDDGFQGKYWHKMMEPVEAQGWEGMMPLRMDVNSTLVRLFYCNLEV